MKYLLFITLLIITACGQQQAPQKSGSEAIPAMGSQFLVDSVKVNPTVDYVTGRFNYRSHPNFMRVGTRYADEGTYLHKATRRAFKAMADSARKDSVNLTVISGTRNFASQKSIWDRKWQNSDASSGLAKATEILEYSSMPMTSRHHWGTDIDINDLNNSYFESDRGKKEYEWLKVNANGFGFYQPYTDKNKNNRTGYNEEKWHWSYMPLAGPYLTYYNNHITNADIKGFEGAELAKEINMVKNYVNGVSEKVKGYSK